MNRKSDFSKVPNSLRGYPFCVWKYKVVDGKKKKPPYTPRRINDRYIPASANDPTTFGTFEEAVQVYNTEFPYFDGIGMLVTDGIAAIDIDHCIDEDGNLNDMAIDVFNKIETYSEISPSHFGLRMIALCDQSIYNKTSYKQKIEEPQNLEVYIGSQVTRYVTITGDVIRCGEVFDRTKEIKEVLEKYLKQPQVKTSSNTNNATYKNSIDEPEQRNIQIDGDKQLQKALCKNQEFKKLFFTNPNFNECDRSKLDESFFQHCAFWTRCNPQMMEDWFYMSNLSDREKASRKDYVERSIQKAIDECDNMYDPNYGRKNRG